MVNGRDIVSWAAVDRDDLIGFVTARIILAKESEVKASQISIAEWKEEKRTQ